MYEWEILTNRKRAKEKGQIVSSIEDLICRRHRDAHFEAIGTIPEFDSFVEGVKGYIYECKSCGEEWKKFDEKHNEFIKLGLVLLRLAPPGSTIAYDCPECGIVKGTFKRRNYRDRVLPFFVAGEEYTCRICDIHLGMYNPNRTAGGPGITYFT